MATWKTRGLRGSLLEDLVNRTNDKYREQGLALIQKVPTPITPMQIDQESRHITLAYFNQKSTVDYIGVVQGIPVCFDAKECAGTTFSLQNVHPHQVQFMREFEQQEGIAFFLIYFSRENMFYYLPLRGFMPFWDRAQEGGRKSVRFEEIDTQLRIWPNRHGILLKQRVRGTEDLLRNHGLLQFLAVIIHEAVIPLAVHRLEQEQHQRRQQAEYELDRDQKRSAFLIFLPRSFSSYRRFIERCFFHSGR